jgi:hypothetical protein
MTRAARQREAVAWLGDDDEWLHDEDAAVSNGRMDGARRGRVVAHQRGISHAVSPVASL